MTIRTLLLFSALLTPIRAQTPPTPASQAQPAKPDDDLASSKLSPEQLAKTQQLMDRLNKAITDKDVAAIDQVNKEMQENLRQLKNPDSPTGDYYYRATPTAAPQPATPNPCAVPPKKGGWFETAKKRLKQTIEGQAGKLDTQVGKATNGKVDPGAKDTATAAVNAADQPCVPAKK
jgi:hypothetical protein